MHCLTLNSQDYALLNSQDYDAGADITLVLYQGDSVLPGARARNHFAPAVFRRAGLNTTHSDSEGPSVRVLENHSCFFFVLHLSMVQMLGLLLLLALPASVDAGGAPSLSRHLCRVFSLRTRASSGVKCSKSREYAVRAAVRCTARLDSSDPCFPACF